MLYALYSLFVTVSSFRDMLSETDTPIRLKTG